jgi:hypothetical protein
MTATLTQGGIFSMSRLLHSLYRSAKARGLTRRPAPLSVLAIALSLAFLIPAIATTEGTLSGAAAAPLAAPGTIAGVVSTGTDNADNHWVAVRFSAPGKVTGGQVSLATNVPELDFECPKTGTTADPNDYTQWTITHYFQNAGPGAMKSPTGCTQDVQVVRWIVDIAYQTPTNPVVSGQLSSSLISPTNTVAPSTATPRPPTAIPPTATPLPPTATPLPPTATPLPPTARPATSGVGICNGVADDTAAIQASLKKGGVTTVNAGVCMISAPLTYGSNATLVGQGQDVTTIRNRSDLNGAIMLQPTGNGVAHFTLRNLTLDAAATTNEDNKFTVSADATSYFLSDHVTYRHVQQMAIWTDGAGGTATNHLSIDNSRVMEAFGDGFSFFGEIVDSSITNSEVMHCMDDAIAFQEKIGYWGASGYPRNITITGNNIHDCTERNSFGSTANGINVYGSDNVTVNNNHITNVVAAGLNLSYGLNRRATNIHAYNNTIDQAGYNHAGNPGVPPWGIKVENADNVDGGGNTIVNCEWAFRNYNSTNVTGFPWPST